MLFQMIVKMRIHLEKLSRLNVASIIVVSSDLPQQSFIQVFIFIVYMFLLIVLRTVLGYHNVVYLVALWIIILIHNISKINQLGRFD